MAEYIERKRLEEAFDNADPDVCESYPDGYSDWGFGRKNVREVISSVPAADVAPVVHGEWEAADWREYDANSCEVICYPKDGIACTHCRYVFKKDALWKKNFCPNCGAKMDGGAENG